MFNAFYRLFSSRATLAALFVALVVLVTALRSFPQQTTTTPRLHLRGYTTVMPLRGATREMARSTALASSTVPMWDYSIAATRNSNNIYTGSMIGRSPFFHGARTTNIPTYIVPLIIRIPDASNITYDPTINNTCAPAGVPKTLLEQSPIMQTFNFTMNSVNVGTSQYVDGYQRANFWTKVSVTGNRHHTVLNPVTTLAPVTVPVPTTGCPSNCADAKSFNVGACGHSGNLGVLNIDWFDSYLTTTLIPSLAGQGVGPTSFPIFLMNDVVMSTVSPPTLFTNCCILGYHGAFGVPTQTYSPSDFDTTGSFSGTSDTSVYSHEVGEWMDDPLGTNATPLWGHIGQVSGCQNNLENGDPLSGTLFPGVLMPNGITYNLQELAFFSWFFGTPALGTGGKFSNNGTFTSDAGAICS